MSSNVAGTLHRRAIKNEDEMVSTPRVGNGTPRVINFCPFNGKFDSLTSTEAVYRVEPDQDAWEDRQGENPPQFPETLQTKSRPKQEQWEPPAPEMRKPPASTEVIHRLDERKHAIEVGAHPEIVSVLGNVNEDISQMISGGMKKGKAKEDAPRVIEAVQEVVRRVTGELLHNIDVLKQQVTHKEADSAYLKQEMVRHNDIMKEYRAKLDRTVERLRKSDTVMDLLRGQVSRRDKHMAEQREAYLKLIIALKEQITSLKMGKETDSGQVDVAETVVASLGETVDEVDEAEAESLARQRAEFEMEKKKMERDHMLEIRKLEKVAKEKDRMHEKEMEMIHERFSDLKNTIDFGKVNDLQQDLEQTKLDVARLSKEKSILEEFKKDHLNDVARMSQEIIRLEENLDQAKERIEFMDKEEKNTMLRIKEEQKRNEDLEEKLNATRLAKEELTNKITEKLEEINEKEMECDELKVKISALERMTQEEESNPRGEATMEKLRMEKKQLELKYKKLEQDSASKSRSILEQAAQSVESIRKEKETIKKDLEGFIALGTLEDIQAKMSEFDTLQKEVEDLRAGANKLAAPQHVTRRGSYASVGSDAEGRELLASVVPSSSRRGSLIQSDRPMNLSTRRASLGSIAGSDSSALTNALAAEAKTVDVKVWEIGSDPSVKELHEKLEKQNKQITMMRYKNDELKEQNKLLNDQIKRYGARLSVLEYKDALTEGGNSSAASTASAEKPLGGTTSAHRTPTPNEETAAPAPSKKRPARQLPSTSGYVVPATTASGAWKQELKGMQKTHSEKEERHVKEMAAVGRLHDQAEELLEKIEAKQAELPGVSPKDMNKVLEESKLLNPTGKPSAPKAGAKTKGTVPPGGHKQASDSWLKPKPTTTPSGRPHSRIVTLELQDEMDENAGPMPGTGRERGIQPHAPARGAARKQTQQKDIAYFYENIGKPYNDVGAQAAQRGRRIVTPTNQNTGEADDWMVDYVLQQQARREARSRPGSSMSRARSAATSRRPL